MKYNTAQALLSAMRPAVEEILVKHGKIDQQSQSIMATKLASELLDKNQHFQDRRHLIEFLHVWNTVNIMEHPENQTWFDKDNGKPKHAEPPPINDAYKQNFKYLKLAIKNGGAALVGCIEKESGDHRVLLCAMQRNEDGTVTLVPYAVMVWDNPYERFEYPTVRDEKPVYN